MKISAVILNWNRPLSLKHLILPSLCRHPLISEIIISHGMKKTMFSYQSSHCSVIHRDDSKTNKEYGLSRRFLAANNAKNECVLIMDDDLIPKKSTISTLYQYYKTNQDIIHGVFGRELSHENKYNFKNIYGDVPLVLTRIMIMNRQKANDFFKYATKLDKSILKKGLPYWNGEDLFMSLLSLKTSQTFNKAYNLPIYNLYYSSLFGISNNILTYLFKGKRFNHKDYRTRFIQHVIETLGLDLSSLKSN